MSWAGNILRIDLSTGSVRREPTARFQEDYIGGAGIAARIFWEEVPPDTRAYDPANILAFNTGPLTGTLWGSRATVATKTPERANHPFVFVGMGGQFPSEMKYAGYDNILIKGKAEKPVYLFINNDSVEIRDAAHLWGLDTYETQTRIKAELRDPEVQVACIGPAGENMVVYALILHDIDNTASRKVGAVMGSKNLKAIAVRGTKGLKISDPKAFLDLYDQFYREITEGQAAAFIKIENTEGISRQIAEGYHYAYGTEVPDKILSSPMKEFLGKYMVGPIGCAFCPVQCHQNFRVPGVGNGGTTCVNYFGLIYDKLYNPGEFELWWKRTLLANRYGIDSLSVEMIGSWLIELFKKGIITIETTDGIPMEKSSDRAITGLIEKVAKGEGFGKIFAKGIVSAAQQLGKQSLKYADQYDNAFPYSWADLAPDLGPVAQWRTGEVERVPGFGDGYGNIPAFAEVLKVSPRRARDMIDRFCDEASERITGDKNVWKTPKYNRGISLIVVEKESEVLLSDLTGHCEVRSSYLEHYGLKFGIDHFSKWLQVTTGKEYTLEQLHDISHRMRLLVDSYNLMCARMIGEKPAVGIPIESLTVFPQPGRPKDPVELKKVQTDYCELMGYDPQTGVPVRERLEKLGLKDVADKLEASSDNVKAGNTPGEEGTD